MEQEEHQPCADNHQHRADKNDLFWINSKFDETELWTNPVQEHLLLDDFMRTSECVKSFDQNGYDLCLLEQLYAQTNMNPEIKCTQYRGFRTSIHKPWFKQNEKLSGYVLNHSMLLERKGYGGEALKQLIKYAKYNPLIYKLINYKTKWGLDLSIDYVDESGECFEVFHYEYDSFDINKINKIKENVEQLVSNTNFDEVVRDLKNKKSEWFNLEFFAQSEWKTNYFNLEPERFKMIGWQ